MTARTNTKNNPPRKRNFHWVGFYHGKPCNLADVIHRAKVERSVVYQRLRRGMGAPEGKDGDWNFDLAVDSGDTRRMFNPARWKKDGPREKAVVK